MPRPPLAGRRSVAALASTSGRACCLLEDNTRFNDFSSGLRSKATPSTRTYNHSCYIISAPQWPAQKAQHDRVALKKRLVRNTYLGANGFPGCQVIFCKFAKHVYGKFLVNQKHSLTTCQVMIWEWWFYRQGSCELRCPGTTNNAETPILFPGNDCFERNLRMKSIQKEMMRHPQYSDVLTAIFFYLKRHCIEDLNTFSQLRTATEPPPYSPCLPHFAKISLVAVDFHLAVPFQLNQPNHQASEVRVGRVGRVGWVMIVQHPQWISRQNNDADSKFGNQQL